MCIIMKFNPNLQYVLGCFLWVQCPFSSVIVFGICERGLTVSAFERESSMTLPISSSSILSAADSKPSDSKNVGSFSDPLSTVRSSPTALAFPAQTFSWIPSTERSTLVP